VRRRFWDLVTVAAIAGVLYSTLQMVEYHGWSKGLVGAIAAGALGILAVQVLYPLWFGGDDGTAT